MNIYTHTAQDRTPYTYLIGWSKMKLYYYGVRFSKNCHPSDLWNPYKTSSTWVALTISFFGEPDIIQTRKTFKSIEEARKWEHQVLRRMKVVNRDDFLNKSDNKSVDPRFAIKGGKKKKPYKNPNDIRIEISRKNMKLIHSVYGMQYQSSEERKSASKKAANTKRERRSQGAYVESEKRFKEKMSLKTKAKGHFNRSWFTSSHGRKMAELNNGPAICPHCNKIGQYRAMKRWHFEKCKFKVQN